MRLDAVESSLVQELCFTLACELVAMVTRSDRWFFKDGFEGRAMLLDPPPQRVNAPAFLGGEISVPEALVQFLVVTTRNRPFQDERELLFVGQRVPAGDRIQADLPLEFQSVKKAMSINMELFSYVSHNAPAGMFAACILRTM
jgi:hypothetical protein